MIFNIPSITAVSSLIVHNANNEHEHIQRQKLLYGSFLRLIKMDITTIIFVDMFLIHLHLVLRLKSRAIHLLFLWAFMACSRVTLDIFLTD